MLRVLVIAGETERDGAMASGREVVAHLDAAHEVVAVAPASGSEQAANLDAALMLWPPAEVVVVLGRQARGGAADALFSATMLDLREDLAAITSGDDLTADVGDIVRYGAAFRAGPLRQAGGFSGDGRTSVHDRLAALGWASAVMPAPGAPVPAANAWPAPIALV